MASAQVGVPPLAEMCSPVFDVGPQQIRRPARGIDLTATLDVTLRVFEG